MKTGFQNKQATIFYWYFSMIHRYSEEKLSHTVKTDDDNSSRLVKPTHFIYVKKLTVCHIEAYVSQSYLLTVLNTFICLATESVE